MDSESSETNLVIITRRDRFKLFYKLYWRTLIILIAPIILLPVIFIKDNNAYKSFYVFLLMVVYWLADVLHPAVTAIVPIAISSIMGGVNKSFMYEMCLRNDLIDCIGVMMLTIAIEHSNVHRRIALKVLLVFGCSHYRLSFLLFFTTMFLSMWISSVLACGLMMPLVKAILTELEKMGILEIYQTIDKARQKSQRHEQSTMRPSEITVFYFLGIAYSSSIGNMATMMGSQTNQIFKIYCETIFPVGPKIEFPHFMLLNLPGVLMMEALLYFWMNFYFLGMFRHHSAIAIGLGMTEEEAQYIDTLLATQYQQLGKIQSHEFTVAAIVLLAGLLQATTSSTHIHQIETMQFHDHIRMSSPSAICVILLFILPINMDFVKFFKPRSDLGVLIDDKLSLNEHVAKIVNNSFKMYDFVMRSSTEFKRPSTYLYLFKTLVRSQLEYAVPIWNPFYRKYVDAIERVQQGSDPLPSSQSKSCLSWDVVNREINWSVPFILGGSSCLFESLRESEMTTEFEKFLSYFSYWPTSAFVFIVVVFCNILTQFAPNSCVVYALLPSIAKMSIICDMNPHYLMMAATLGSSLSFHLVNGSAVNAMVCEYVHIPPWKMMSAGVAPSLFASVVIWFTVTVWSTAIWTDINLAPDWADINVFNIHNKST